MLKIQGGSFAHLRWNEEFQARQEESCPAWLRAPMRVAIVVLTSDSCGSEYTPFYATMRPPVYDAIVIRFQSLTIACFLLAPSCGAAAQPAPASHLVRERQGAIIRGDVNEKKLALIFTGDSFAESMEQILDALKQRGIKAGFFVTGNFVRDKTFRPLLKRAIAEGHYIGPHSDTHPLYAPWDNRDKTLVTEAFFKKDLKNNIAALVAIGALTRDQPVLFIPPYEYYNRDQAKWARDLGVTIFNFTPGSGSNRDYMREDDPHFASSQRIYDDILAYERRDRHGLNGFILLLHLGSGRRDAFHARLGPLCDELTKRGYEFERIDQLLK
jgi:peptidoglycan/xylan/chitin deacetylase (PgdA/CDA1 family)